MLPHHPPLTPKRIRWGVSRRPIHRRRRPTTTLRRMAIRPHTSTSRRTALASPNRRLQPSLLLKIPPPLHSNLTRIKLPIRLMPARLLPPLLLPHKLPSITPREVVEVPVGVARQDQVPDGEGEEIDAHPEDVGEAVGGDDDEDAGEADDEGEEDEGDGWGRGVSYCCFDA